MAKTQFDLDTQLMKAFETVLTERKEYYQKNNITLSTAHSADIIDKYTNYNTGVAGMAGLIPGFLGTVSVVPEIVLIFRNQVAMLYDLGKAHGQSALLTPEFLAALFLASQDGTVVSVFVQSEDAVVYRKTNEKFTASMLSEIGKRILWRIGRSFLCRWVPLLGAAALAVYARLATNKMGEYAQKFFSSRISVAEAPEQSFVEITDTEIDGAISSTIIDNEPARPPMAEEPATAAGDHTPNDLPTDNLYDPDSGLSPLFVDEPLDNIVPSSASVSLEELKIQALINLMKIDNDIATSEAMYIEEVIKRCRLNKETKEELYAQIHSNKTYTIDFSRFNSSRADALGMIVDLVTLAKRDGEIRPEEREYLQKAAQAIGVSDTNLEAMMRH